jgi:GDPmannose 4,6-dehydratase
VPTALITGITGQDGSYLAELLLERGYRVVGLTRDRAGAAQGWLAPLADRIDLVAGDLADGDSIAAAVRAAAPDEVDHLAAETATLGSWDDPERVADITATGTVRLLEAVRRGAAGARVAVASSSEIFGAADRSPQDETTPVRPRSPYGAAKAYAFAMTRAYREHHGMFAAAAVLYNHESPRRPLDFVTRKVTDAVARTALGSEGELRLGNLDSVRDWGYAPDYVEALWRMLQADAPDDYVVGTGRGRTVRDLCAAAFGAAGLDWREHVVEDERFWRPAESVPLVADPTRAAERLGWTAATSFDRLITIMVEADLERHRGTISKSQGDSPSPVR